jgi:hypothetical protein
VIKRKALYRLDSAFCAKRKSRVVFAALDKALCAFIHSFDVAAATASPSFGSLGAMWLAYLVSFFDIFYATLIFNKPSTKW